MNGIIAFCVILTIIIISVIAVEITNNRNAELKNFFEHPHKFFTNIKEDDDGVSKHK